MADNGSGKALFEQGCSSIGRIMKECESNGCDIYSDILEGYRLLERSFNMGCAEASRKAIEYFVEGAFPVFDEKTTLEILMILAEFGFDEALFLCGYFYEFGTDGNPPENPGKAHDYYQRSYDLAYAPSTVSLARSEMYRMNYSKALELYEKAVKEDLRERREAVISIGFIQYFGLVDGTPSAVKALETWTPLGTRTLVECKDYCGSESPHDLKRLLEICRVSFEIGML